MKPIGVVVIGFFYLLSAGYYLADVVFLTPAGIDTENLRGENLDAVGIMNENRRVVGNVYGNATVNSAGGSDTFDQVLGFSFQGFEAVWDLITLLTGTRFFEVLGLLGVHPALIGVIQGIFGLIVVRTIIYFILGR